MDVKFYNIHTIYDLVIYAYEKINGRCESKIISQYLDTAPSYRSEITELMREVLLCNLTVEEFAGELHKYLKHDLEQVCMHILVEFDRYYSECDKYRLISEITTKNIIEFEVQNNVSNQFAFYPMSQSNFVMKSKVMEKARVHRNRKGIWDLIQSYRINRISDSENYVLIKKYKNNEIEQTIAKNACLNMAVVPFSNRSPFEEDECGVLKERQYNDEEIERMYKDCIALLKELDERGIDIIIFPEIVMTEMLIMKIKKWLQKNAIQGTNMKLLFMGSFYKNDINRCVLLSGTGNELLSNDKQNGFAYHDKEGNLHRENLGNKSDVIYLLDMRGLGRIWYLICKDAILYSESIRIAEEYDCNVRVVSAYSNSISDFQTVGEMLAKAFQVFSIVCNSCAVRIGKHIGVVSYPVFYNEGKNIADREKKYACARNCQKCVYAKCAHIWQFCVAEQEVEGQKQPTTGLAVKYFHYEK